MHSVDGEDRAPGAENDPRISPADPRDLLHKYPNAANPAASPGTPAGAAPARLRPRAAGQGASGRAVIMRGVLSLTEADHVRLAALEAIERLGSRATAAMIELECQAMLLDVAITPRSEARRGRPSPPSHAARPRPDPTAAGAGRTPRTCRASVVGGRWLVPCCWGSPRPRNMGCR